MTGTRSITSPALGIKVVATLMNPAHLAAEQTSLGARTAAPC